MQHLCISVPLIVPGKAQPSTGNLGVERLRRRLHCAVKIGLTPRD